LNSGAVHSSEKLTLSYDLVLYSLGLMHFTLVVIRHFRYSMQRERREMLAARLSNGQIMRGLTVSYVLFFFIGFSIPIYAVALFEQLYYAPQNTQLFVFVWKSLAPLGGLLLFWIVLALFLIIRFRAEFTALALFVLAYALLFFGGRIASPFFLTPLGILSLALFEELPLQEIILPFLGWLFFTGVALWYGSKISRNLLTIELADPFRKGLSARLSETMGAFLAAHHFKMMGLESQKILAAFAFAGLVLVLIAVGNPGANLIVFAKIYLGAFMPILFSLNQYYVIQLDRDAGMIQSNSLRSMSFPRIVLNRWKLLLLPQLLTTLVCALIVARYTGQLSWTIVPYLLLVNIFCSLLNLFFAAVSRTGGVSNVALLFLVYLLLREDVQTWLDSTQYLTYFNVFSPLTREDPAIPATIWLALVVLIFGLVFASTVTLESRRFDQPALA
jgi:hypothetical protein